MEPIDYVSLQNSYGGKFVAIRADQVLASGDTHEQMVRELEEKHLDSEDVVFEYIRPKDCICAY